MNKTGKRLLCAALALVLPLVPLTPVFAADTDEIHIQTAEDLIELSRNCSLDTWSDGLSVILDNDLSLSDVDYDPIPIREGHVFGLGGRHVKVVETPCHSPGDLMFLDVENRLLFTGDNLEVGQVLIFYGDGETGGTVKRHLEILKKMEAHYDEIDFICPGHNGSPIHRSVLKDFIENDERVLSGIEGTAELPSPSFNLDFFLPSEERRKYVRCSEWKNTWLIYDTRRVYKSERLFYTADSEEL